MIAEAAAVNVVAIAPGGTDTDAGTVNFVLFEASPTVTGVDPALVASVTEHVALWPPAKDAGVQFSDARPDGGCITTPVAGILVPLFRTALSRANERGFDGIVDAVVIVTFAITPSAMVFWLIPNIRHVIDPGAALQVVDLLAADVAGPLVTTTLVTDEAG